MVTFHALYIIIRDNKLAIVFLFRQPPHPPPPSPYDRVCSLCKD